MEVAPSVTTLTTTQVATETELPTTDVPDDGVQEVLTIIVGSGLVGLILLLVLAVMLLFVVWAIQRHRKKKMKRVSATSDERNLENPLYTGIYCVY